jgi:hypothetical protein
MVLWVRTFIKHLVLNSNSQIKLLEFATTQDFQHKNSVQHKIFKFWNREREYLAKTYEWRLGPQRPNEDAKTVKRRLN